MRECSGTSLRSLEIARLNEADILEKELRAALTAIADARATALLARLLIEHRQTLDIARSDEPADQGNGTNGDASGFPPRKCRVVDVKLARQNF
jgi:hypothetical protein